MGQQFWFGDLLNVFILPSTLYWVMRPPSLPEGTPRLSSPVTLLFFGDHQLRTPADSPLAPTAATFKGVTLIWDSCGPIAPLTSQPLASFIAGLGTPRDGGLTTGIHFSCFASVSHSPGGVSFINVVHPIPGRKSRILVNVSSLVSPGVLLSQRTLPKRANSPLSQPGSTEK